MGLPFLKNREGAAAMPVEEEGGEPDMLDAVAEDMLAAVKKGDKSLLREALAALVEHVREEDVIQDEQIA